MRAWEYMRCDGARYGVRARGCALLCVARQLSEAQLQLALTCLGLPAPPALTKMQLIDAVRRDARTHIRSSTSSVRAACYDVHAPFVIRSLYFRCVSAWRC